MATKKCPNGHQYDSSIYGDNCPFCPSAHATQVIDNPSAPTQVVGNDNGRTQVIGGNPAAVVNNPTKTVPINPNQNQEYGGRTVIRPVNPGATSDPHGGKKLVGLLVSYDQNPLGEVYKVFEGRNMIGRSASVDIPIVGDNSMSSEHLLILYREAEGVYWATDNNSSNGTYINGVFTGERTKIQTNDVIVVGATKFIFLAIPQF